MAAGLGAGVIVTLASAVLAPTSTTAAWGITAAGVAAGMRVQGYAADGDEGALRAAGAEILWSLGELPARLGLA